ncbi:MAG: ankyrin repeat domain-containing protein [Rickettsiales bacterium]
MAARLFLFIVLLFSHTTAIAVDSQLNDQSFGNQIIDDADKGNDGEVSGYLRNKVSPNTKGIFDTTPLIRASINGHASTVRLLLEAGANPNQKDIGGATALHLAARNGHLEVVKLLLRYGANPETPDNEGYSALKRAIKSQHIAIVNEMLNKGADVDDKGKIGISARQLGVSSKNPKLKEIFEQYKSVEVAKLGDELLRKQSLPIPDEKTEATKHTLTVREEEAKKPEPPMLLTDKNVRVNVAEAVKVPLDVDLTAKQKPIEKNFVEPKDSRVETAPVVLRPKSMEISGFVDEDEALAFWQEFSEKSFVKGKAANIVHDNSTGHTRYYIRFKNFTSATEVFNTCKEVRKYRKTLLCYSVHDIY